MKTLLMINEKGGVGKTTLAVNLATSLAAQGKRVMLVDGDAQGHSTIQLQQERSDGLARLLLQNAAFQSVVVRVPPSQYGGSEEGYLLLMPSDAATASIPEAIKARRITSLLLAERLRELDSYLDYIVIDSSPTISELHAAFYLAADSVIYPTQCEFLSIEGLTRSIDHLRRAQQIAKERGMKCADVGAIVPNMFNGRELVQYQNLGWLQGTFGLRTVLTPIRLRTAWKQASQLRTPIQAFDGKSDASSEARTFVREIVERVG